MGRPIDPAGESPPSPSEAAIPDPLDNAPPPITEEEVAEVEGTATSPDTITGRADASAESLTSLFANRDPDHLKDGFAGSGNEFAPGDPSRSQNDGDLPDEKV